MVACCLKSYTARLKQAHIDARPDRQRQREQQEADLEGFWQSPGSEALLFGIFGCLHALNGCANFPVHQLLVVITPHPTAVICVAPWYVLHEVVRIRFDIMQQQHFVGFVLGVCMGSVLGSQDWHVSPLGGVPPKALGTPKSIKAWKTRTVIFPSFAPREFCLGWSTVLFC